MALVPVTLDRIHPRSMLRMIWIGFWSRAQIVPVGRSMPLEMPERVGRELHAMAS
jgi:hypothetical protein